MLFSDASLMLKPIWQSDYKILSQKYGTEFFKNFFILMCIIILERQNIGLTIFLRIMEGMKLGSEYYTYAAFTIFHVKYGHVQKYFQKFLTKWQIFILDMESNVTYDKS